jgi:threonine aldolase
MDKMTEAMFVTTSQYQKTPNKRELQNRLDRIVEICEVYKQETNGNNVIIRSFCDHVKKIAAGESH